jgi:hypothetical protein
VVFFWGHLLLTRSRCLQKYAATIVANWADMAFKGVSKPVMKPEMKGMRCCCFPLM